MESGNSTPANAAMWQQPCSPQKCVLPSLGEARTHSELGDDWISTACLHTADHTDKRRHLNAMCESRSRPGREVRSAAEQRLQR